MKKNGKIFLKSFHKKIGKKLMKAAHFSIRLQASSLSLIVEKDKHEDLEKTSKAG